MLGGLDDIRVVTEEKIDKDLVNFLWYKLAVLPVLCCIGYIYWVDIWVAVQVLVDVIEKDPIG